MSKADLMAERRAALKVDGTPGVCKRLFERRLL